MPSRRRLHHFALALGRNKGLVAVTAIGFIMFAAILAIFQALWVRQTSTMVAVREDALWATYQVDHEAGRLAEALTAFRAGEPDVTLKEVGKRFDILYSRHEVMEDSDFASKFRNDADLMQLSAEVSKQLHAILPTFDRIAATGDASREELARTLDAVRTLRRTTESLLTTTNHLQTYLQVDEREETSRIYAWLAGATTVMTIAMGLVIVMIWRQLRQNETSRFRLQRLSEELAHSAAAAEAGNKAKSAFLATMSHEIRTPLNGIIGMAELMADGVVEPQQIEQLRTIRQCSEQLIAIINDVLDFSKLESGMIDLEQRETDLADVVDGVVDMLAPRAEAKGLELVASYPLGAYVTDPTRLRQVLLNLAGNAVKFTDRGVVAIRVFEIHRRTGDLHLRFQVEDTGIGISPDNLTRLFSEFTQADASINRRFGGTGLGLAISKRVVEALDGRIGVESREKQGSTFWLEIPVERRRAGVEMPAIAGVEARVRADLPLVTGLVERSLMSIGVTVHSAQTGARRIPLTLMDVPAFQRVLARGESYDAASTVVFGFGAKRWDGRVATVMDGPLTSRKLARLIAHRAVGTAFRSALDVAKTIDELPVVHRGRVLVVEDNEVNRKVVGGILARLGYECESAEDGAHAVERLARPGIDIVLMDMQMPVMDGLEVTRRIRAFDGPAATLPIIGLTANAFASDRAACFEAGMNDFVTKPVTRDKLETALAAFADRVAEPEAVTRPDAEPTPTTRPSAPETETCEIDAPAPLDLTHRAHLAEELGDDCLAELTDVFRADAVRLVEEMDRARSTGDREAMRRALHTLTGAAANVGFVGVVAAISDVRAAGGIDCVDALVRVRKALAEGLAGLGPGGTTVEGDADRAA